ncbi:MAG: hypothetical protein LBK72_08050 [Bifidobacteriaceae bacterium]|jgi:hypothetical protein|nr:hypothetical protein [Bifidobacteriaceae bacterium]
MDSDSPDTPRPPAADTEVIEVVPDLPPAENPQDGPVSDEEPATGGAATSGTGGWRPVASAEPGEPTSGSAEPRASRKATREAAKSKRKVWIAVGAVAATAVVLTVAVVMVARARTAAPEAPPPEPVVVSVTVPPPSPTLSPVALPAETAFAQVLPRTVGEFALREADSYPEWSADGAIEAYLLVYGDGTTEVGVIAGQWPTPDAAAAARDASPALDTTPLSAGGVTWVNETAVIAVGGPADLAERFEALFPM